MSDIEWHDIQRKLTEAIINFEPRILPQGLQVRCVSDTSSLDLHNVLSIEIKGVYGACRTRWSFCFAPMSIWKTAILN